MTNDLITSEFTLVWMFIVVVGSVISILIYLPAGSFILGIASGLGVSMFFYQRIKKTQGDIG